ncbi:MAG: hypothetical protein ACC631_09835 [Halocynthiibacter sp.]
MQWIIENWILLALGGGMLVMHLFGHGKHGGHGGRNKHGDSNNNQTKTDMKESKNGSKVPISPTSVPKFEHQTGKQKQGERSDNPEP